MTVIADCLIIIATHWAFVNSIFRKVEKYTKKVVDTNGGVW